MSEVERGSVALWMLGLSVLLLFTGGISLDLWRAFGERRGLSGMVDAAAAAGATALDERAYRTSGAVQLDPAAARARATAHLAAHPVRPGLVSTRVDASTETVSVHAAADVHLTLLRILLPRSTPLRVSVRATADARDVP